MQERSIMGRDFAALLQHVDVFRGKFRLGAVALGVDYLGAVRGQRLSFLPIFLSNQRKYVFQLRQGGIARIHQGIASRDRGNLRDPGTIFLAIDDRFVVLAGHATRRIIRQTQRVVSSYVWL